METIFIVKDYSKGRRIKLRLARTRHWASSASTTLSYHIITNANILAGVLLKGLLTKANHCFVRPWLPLGRHVLAKRSAQIAQPSTSRVVIAPNNSPLLQRAFMV